MGSRGLERKFKCSYCNKFYGQDWTLNSHKNSCKELHEAINKK